MRRLGVGGEGMRRLKLHFINISTSLYPYTPHRYAR